MTAKMQVFADRHKLHAAMKNKQKQAEVDNYVFTRQRATARRRRNSIGYRYVVAGQV